MRTACLILAVVLTVSLVCVGCGGKPPRQHYEKAGAFSYDPPSGWQVVEFPGLKYRISHGPRENEFTPNINVVDEAFSGTLAAYVDANLQNMERVFVNLKVLSREDLKTKDNEAAVKVVTENEQQGRMLRQTFFFIGPGNRKYVVTCTALVDGGDKFDTAFAETAKTFRMH
jgi:hypothetical protein